MIHLGNLFFVGTKYCKKSSEKQRNKMINCKGCFKWLEQKRCILFVTFILMLSVITGCASQKQPISVHLILQQATGRPTKHE